MKHIITLLILFSLSGCDRRSNELANYRCSEEQLNIVQNEITLCLDSGYTNTFCYYSIKKAQCDNIKPDNIE